MPKKGAWTVCRFKGGASQKRGGGLFEGWGGGLIPQCALRSDSVSKLAIASLDLKLRSSSANVKESWIVYLLSVSSSNIGTKNFSKLYVGVPMADKLV